MTEARERYHAGPADRAEPPLTTEVLVAAAHAHRQGIPYSVDRFGRGCLEDGAWEAR